MHEQCWQYAEKKLYPSGKPNLQELYEVLCKVPPSRGMYHYVLSVFCIFSNQVLPDYGGACIDPAYSDPSQYHPCREKTLEEFLQGDREFPGPSRCMKEKTSSSSNPTDPFRRLPLEIREKVALLLPSHEFLDLRRVSRAMSAVFHDNFFWKSRFKRDADHGYLDYIACGVTDLDQSGIQSQNTDWRLLYHASMNIGNKLETTVKVWEVVQWIKEVLAAQNGLQESPLWFSGRALQHYHNDSCATGRRVERAKISPSLAKIGVTMVSSKTVHERDEAQTGWKMFETETDILAVEFISKEHENITLGTRNKKSKNICPRNLENKMDAYYGQENARGETKKPAPESPFDGNGVRVLFNAKPEDFGGFRIRYFDEKISSLGVLSKNMAYSHRNEPQAFGFDANDECAFDIGMEMQDIVEVVATFEVCYSQSLAPAVHDHAERFKTQSRVDYL